ncbi:putative HXXXD-type acyl-transferase family protein [Hibiscus syriacus]|uniref:RING-type E3 ubiquitin transferase n=1 Tax=Hibiscus syriacus TaxID=106335 RepID=A0A6A2WT09_HIBSY|nr:putative HXXXD-type acyl-transferase family protein [Hibiscus syriacus]
MSDSTNDTLTDNCNVCFENCISSCYEFCPVFCPRDPPYVDQYPPPSPDSGSNSNKPNTFVIVISTLLAATFLALCCLVYYARRRANSRGRSSQAETDEIHNEFLEEDHGPIVDHPIWYINTVGLQPSIIRSIAVCKYKRGEGLVEGTDCSVCLNEFQEDETLRLLPKCSHAFHIPCIDTWLRSHTNCPLCRAPIVSNAANRGPLPSSAAENLREELMLGGSGTREIRDGEEEIAAENEGNEGENSETGDEGIQPMRRSVSLDSMEASQISHDLVNGNSYKEASVRIVPRRAAGNQSLLRLMYHSSFNRSYSLQNKPIFLRRSFSYSGKFSLPINNKNHNANPPLRSF